jgi:PAS domain S-box-containing protein
MTLKQSHFLSFLQFQFFSLGSYPNLFTNQRLGVTVAFTVAEQIFNMAGLLYVLVVEDSENDTSLLLEELRQKGYAPVHERVEHAAAMTSALEQRNWDVVVSDYVMPDFSGPNALKLLREKNLDVPFIVVSGTYGEEAAVDMMKAGANDYITKANLSRLAPAIEREIEAAKNRKARAHAENSMRHLAAIVKSTDDAIYGLNLDGAVASWNHAAEKIFGYRAEEIIGRSISLLFPFDRRDELVENLQQIRRGESIGRYETLRVRKDGQFIPVSVTVSPIKDEVAKIIGASCIARDITQRKREERERTELVQELTDALKQVKTLSGLLPICATCKRIRDDRGYWQLLESYISSHTNAILTHGICPECLKKVKVEHAAARAKAKAA